MPFPAKKLFDIVIDIEKYPEFIPWCYGVEILSSIQKRITAIMKVKFKGMKAEYISNVDFESPTADNVGYVKVISTKGSFKHLYNLWEFIPKEDFCLVKFYIEYEFNSRILQILMNLVYKKAQTKIINAFKQRAYDLE